MQAGSMDDCFFKTSDNMDKFLIPILIRMSNAEVVHSRLYQKFRQTQHLQDKTMLFGPSKSSACNITPIPAIWMFGTLFCCIGSRQGQSILYMFLCVFMDDRWKEDHCPLMRQAANTLCARICRWTIVILQKKIFPRHLVLIIIKTCEQ